jgi:hypothetical protein
MTHVKAKADAKRTKGKEKKPSLAILSDQWWVPQHLPRHAKVKENGRRTKVKQKKQTKEAIS